MTISKSKQQIENLLTEIKRDLVEIQIKKNEIILNPEVQKLLEAIEEYLKKLVDNKSKVFANNQVNKNDAIRFYNIMLELYLDGFDTLGLEAAIQTQEEDEIITEFKIKFVELMEEISKYM